MIDYELPAQLIAQHPVLERDHARLMVVSRGRQRIEHHIFHELPTLLRPGDLLVLNDSRVLPARVIGRRERTGGKWEGLFLRTTAEGLWEMLAQTKGKPEIGEAMVVDGGTFRLILRGRSNGHWLMEPSPAGSVSTLLHRHGQIPLPPYIRKGRAAPPDQERYQTVYARTDGSVAAPTAGLHFTDMLFDRLAEVGIQRCYVTLHVGLGTFEGIRTEDPRKHVMHHEWAEVPAATVEQIHSCKARGGRVIAVGTTSTRALESAAQTGMLQAWHGETNLYIYPPYSFRVIDGLVTNFHLPRTTLLLLVESLTGETLLQQAYETAIAQEYRFYSYGDAMLILP